MSQSTATVPQNPTNKPHAGLVIGCMKRVIATASSNTVQRSRSQLRPSIQAAYWLSSAPTSAIEEARARALDHRTGCPHLYARPTTTGKARTMEITRSQPVQPNQRLNNNVATTPAARYPKTPVHRIRSGG